MTMKKLEQLLRVTEAHYQREFAMVKDILAKEGSIRRALAQLDEQKTQAHSDLANGMMMQSMGAEILWQTWAAKTRTTLNIELAQVLARKETVMDQVRKAFGRREAVKTMLKAEQKNAAKRKARRLYESLAGC